MIENIKVGISSCLLGEAVRFDAKHKKNAYITGVLQDYFEFVPFCPEVAIGLGIPRESIRLVVKEGQTRCIGSKNPDLDVTDALLNSADGQKKTHQQLCGYILKKDSPSCGMERVRLYNKDIPSRRGVGIYAQRLMENFPHLPIEEEGRLQDVHLRENFIQRVYVYARWRQLLDESLSVAKLQRFHAQHKYVLMSHDQRQTQVLGRLLVNAAPHDLPALADTYLRQMMDVLKVIATKKNHINTLQHIQGYLKKQLDADDKAELGATIEDYRQGLLPLIVPITLLRHHFRKHPNDYMTQSYYMNPHPGELMLLNHI